MSKGSVEVIGARVNNLKNIDVTIPRNSLTVITGLSGSGKSSLAFDTIYAEGQRRYIETFSSYTTDGNYMASYTDENGENCVAFQICVSVISSTVFS